MNARNGSGEFKSDADAFVFATRILRYIRRVHRTFSSGARGRAGATGTTRIVRNRSPQVRGVARCSA
jgi:hypothetical protein